MRKMIDYQILRDADQKYLSSKVRQSFKEGWETLGFPTVDHEGYFIQAVVKYEPNPIGLSFDPSGYSQLPCAHLWGVDGVNPITIPMPGKCVKCGAISTDVLGDAPNENN